MPATLRVFASDRIAVFCEILGHYPDKLRMLDIAAGHCAFAVAAAKMGRKVTCLDARTERVPFAELAKHGIEFIHADVNAYTFDAEQFDLILLLGILYHLTLEEQIALLRRCSARLTIIDTHYSLKPDITHGPYSGHVYYEDAEKRRNVASAWTSPESFWHTSESWLRLFTDSGYACAMKVEPEINPLDRRSFYVCEPVGSSSGPAAAVWS